MMRYMMWRNSLLIRRCVSVLLLTALFAAGMRLAAQSQTMCNGAANAACVLTWQNDNYRTGQNLSEGILLSSNVPSIGQLCSKKLDGQVFAQPLVVTNVTIPPTNGHLYKSVVYVVTENDTLYALQGDPSDSYEPACSILNGTNGLSLLQFLPPNSYPVNCYNIGAMSHGCKTVAPSVGILGTPVININSTGTSGTIYLVTATQLGCSGQCTPSAFAHYLHAIDLAAFTEVSGGPIQICANGCGPYTSSSLFSQGHIQRPGLLYAPKAQTPLGSDYVYAAFSMMDGTPWPWPNGYIVGYKASDLAHGTVYSYSTSQGNGVSQTSFGAGIWQGAAGPAFGVGDNNNDNFIYFNTANGTFNLSSGLSDDAGDSLVKISPSLGTSVTDYFTPADQFYRDDKTCNSDPNKHGNDLDFGSGGPMLIPDSELANWSYLAVSGDKEGGLWFTNRTNLGGHIAACDQSQNQCNCGSVQNTNIVQTYWVGTGYNQGPLIHNSPAFWEGPALHPGAGNYLYVGPYGSAISQYQLCGSSTDTQPICAGALHTTGTTTFQWGVTPTISAASPENASDAIVWALSAADSPLSTSPGTLSAFDALTLGSLYSSGTCLSGRDRIAAATKYSIPTVANGNVYVGAEQCTWNGSTCTNDGTGTFYIFGQNPPTC
jgi:hypothetical protein